MFVDTEAARVHPRTQDKYFILSGPWCEKISQETPRFVICYPENLEIARAYFRIANNKGADKAVQMRSLISTFVMYMHNKADFLTFKGKFTFNTMSL